MKNIIHIKNSLLRVVLGMLIVTLSYTGASAIENKGTTVKRNADGCTVDITIQLALVNGTAADSTDVSTKLNSKYGALSCNIPCQNNSTVSCPVHFIILVRRGANVPAADQGKYHQITMVDDDGNPSNAFIGGTNNSSSGTWRRGRSAETYLHESLHLCGLEDQYCGRNRKGGVINVERECTPATSPCCVPADREGARCTRACPGHETDIMATIFPGTTANCGNNIAPLLTASGFNSCPATCCPPPSNCFYQNNCLPPANSQYTGAVTVNYGGIASLINPTHSGFTGCFPPPTSIGTPVIQSFGSTVTGTVAITGGPTFVMNAPATVVVSTTLIGQTGSVSTYSNEMLSMTIQGGNLPPNIMIRESPSIASTGLTTIQDSTGGHFISSFFDVFTELSLDGGQTWIPASNPAHMELNCTASIPTFNQWGIIALVLTLTAAGIFYIRRRKMVTH